MSTIISTLTVLLSVAAALLLFVWLVMKIAPSKPEPAVLPQTTSSGEEIIYSCPRCGQGGLACVEIKAEPRFEAVVCSECDCIWRWPRLVGLMNYEQLEDALRAVDVEADWSSIVSDSAGVPWSRIEPEYQQLIATKRLVKKEPNQAPEPTAPSGRGSS